MNFCLYFLFLVELEEPVREDKLFFFIPRKEVVAATPPKKLQVVEK